MEIVGSAQRITQFLDRDTRSDFAGPNGMQKFLQTYLKDPGQDLRQAASHPGLLGSLPPRLAVSRKRDPDRMSGRQRLDGIPAPPDPLTGGAVASGPPAPAAPLLAS